MRTAMNCDCEPGSRCSECQVVHGETLWPDKDMELRLRACRGLFAAVSHDLRNKLTGLILWCDTLELLKAQVAAGADEQAMALFGTVLEQIHTLVCHSLHMVDDLLDISRFDAGPPLPLAAAEVDLVGLVHAVLRSRPDATTTRRVRLESVYPELWGWCDADRLARVLENLISNAIKYSPDDEPISVRLAKQDIDGRPNAVLEVQDRGIGIPAEDLPRVFEVFHRGGNVDPTTPGHGLGLWVSRAIVTRHGGTLTLASREGQGTKVTLRLPLSPAAAAPPTDSSRLFELVLGAG